eukprot:m.39046 g.39046  ORF g.39046 m.39046 type:complete len:136 (+) comp10080_c0_seq2:20-427(+)
MSVVLIRRETFSAAHSLRNPNLSEDENREIFGPCFGVHGHNYVLEVALKGRPDPRTGMVMNITELKKHIQNVLGQLDHKHLEADVEYFRLHPSTAENIAIFIWDCLATLLPTGLLHEIHLQETEKNSVRYHGPDA